MSKRSWRTLFTGCYGSSGGSDHLVSDKLVSQQGSIPRVSSSESVSLSLEELSVSLAGSNLYVFTLEELQMATGGFSSSNFVGEGGFGPVYKGFVDERVRPGMEAQAVAVKLLDLAGSQGDREWLVRSQLEFILHPLSLPWLTRLKIAVGAAKGLAFLHDIERPVIYRDFKASNILLDSVILLFFACTKPHCEGATSVNRTDCLRTWPRKSKPPLHHPMIASIPLFNLRRGLLRFRKPTIQDAIEVEGDELTEK